MLYNDFESNKSGSSTELSRDYVMKLCTTTLKCFSSSLQRVMLSRDVLGLDRSSSPSALSSNCGVIERVPVLSRLVTLFPDPCLPRSSSYWAIVQIFEHPWPVELFPDPCLPCFNISGWNSGCRFACLFKWSLLIKRLSHIGHRNFFSPLIKIINNQLTWAQFLLHADN